ncbi:MAG: D-glycero-beta-D-manno-heptose 1-phosphate adenylyltransferase, partial [Deltaproteobacteria bacterium]
KIKGPLRPIVPEKERAFLLASLSFVDAVVLFDDETPITLIEELLPDLLVKGADWKVEEIVGREVVERAGGSVRTVPLVEGRSTTAIIEKILDLYGKRSP